MKSVRNWSLIGIPDHQAVQNVGGRIGAAEGPAAFRERFRKLKGRDGVLESLSSDTDVDGLGDDVATNLENAAKHVLAKAGGLSVVVGGGHDHGFSHLEGVRRQAPDQTLACVNIDAHLDVREPTPLITSGSPFFLAIRQKTIAPERFVEFGIQSHCNAPELWAFVERHGIEVVPMEACRHGKTIERFENMLRKLAAISDRIVISLDLDSAAEAYAPAVSAPQAEGFSSTELVEIAEICGRHPKVVSLGLFELSPRWDSSEKTARLAATIAYHFVSAALKRS